MFKYAVILCAVVIAQTSPAAEEEFLIQVETKRTTASEAATQVQRQEANSIEVVTTLGTRFHGRFRTSDNTVAIHGRLVRDKEGSFFCEIEHETVMTSALSRNAKPSKSFVRTKLKVALDEPFVLGGIRNDSKLKNTTQIETRILKVSRFQPEKPLK